VSIESGSYADPSGEDSSSEAFALEVSDQDGARVLRAVGEIDTVSAPRLRSALLPALESADLVVLDLSAVSFLGSSGLAVLMEARDHPRRGTTGLRLVCTTRIVVRALEATGLRELFDIAPDLGAALRR
jgi:anti-sigma B factor antagonist